MSEHPIAPEYDKARWMRGPWDREPDRVEWRRHGLPCLIVRSHFGALCGYVGLPPWHPWYEREHNDVPVDYIHGGLTYSDKCAGYICHVARKGEPGDVWWIGFDCGHSWDVQPGMGVTWHHGASYKGIPYVRKEVNRLARLARAAEGR